MGGSVFDGTGGPPIPDGVVVIRGSRIATVGSSDDVAVPKGAEIIDASGKTVIPGLIDCHTHFILMGVRTFTTLDLSKTKSLAEVMEQVKGRAPSIPEGAWLEGHGWDESGWPERRYPTKWDLDQVSPDTPVVLSPYYGHLLSVNSEALELANVSKDTPNPPGGEVVKDPETGEPTGILRDEAMGLINSVKPGMSTDVALKGLRKACEIALSWGVTSIHELDADALQFRTYQAALKEGSLRVRAYVMPTARFTEELLDGLGASGIRTGFGNEWLRIGAAKIFIDGSMGARTAVLSEPYDDDPSTTGIFTISPDQLMKRVAKAHGSGLQVAIHAIGDRAIEESLNAYEAAAEAEPRDHRHRIEHCEILTEDQILRIKRLGVVPSMQPNFVGEWGGPNGMYVQRLGPDRLKMNNPYRRFLDEGVTVAFGSDCGYCPPWPMNPLFGIWAAVNHSVESSSITLEEAIRCYTLDAAYASFEEGSKGSLELGKLADVTVLSEDLTSIDPDDIKDVKVDLTIVGGKVEYRV
jgi:predicted amidohydrolase YtcJ